MRNRRSRFADTRPAGAKTGWSSCRPCPFMEAYLFRPSSQGLSLGSRRPLSSGGASCGNTGSLDPRHKGEDDGFWGQGGRKQSLNSANSAKSTVALAQAKTVRCANESALSTVSGFTFSKTARDYGTVSEGAGRLLFARAKLLKTWRFAFRTRGASGSIRSGRADLFALGRSRIKGFEKTHPLDQLGVP